MVCGEALIDLVPEKPGPDPAMSRWQARSAGGPMNTAVSLARLEEPTQFLGRLSTDHFGQQLREHLLRNRVGLDLCVTSAEPTSLAVVDLDAQRNASYTFHFAHTANFGWRAEELPELTEQDWLHVGTLATVVGSGPGVLLDWAWETDARLSYDVNVRPDVIPDPAEYWRIVRLWLGAVGRRHGVVKASADDIAFLAVGAGAVGTPYSIASTWLNQFELSAFLLTLGGEGAVAITPGGIWQATAPAVDVVDTIGAGDSFMAGVLCGIAADLDWQAILERGVNAGAVAVSRPEAQGPTRRELQEFTFASRR